MSNPTLKTALLLSLLLHLLLVSLPRETEPALEAPEPRVPTLLLDPATPSPAPGGFSVSKNVETTAVEPVIQASKRPGKAAPRGSGHAPPGNVPVPSTPQPFESAGAFEFFEFTGELIEPRPLAWNDELEPPRELLGTDWRGEVLLALYIDQSGTPRRVRVVESSGEALADRDAVDYAYASRWLPATRGGEAVGREVQALIRYRVRRRMW